MCVLHRGLVLVWYLVEESQWVYRTWRLVTDKSQTNFVIDLHALSPLFWHIISTAAYHFGRYKLSSPSTKDLDGVYEREREWGSDCDLAWNCWRECSRFKVKAIVSVSNYSNENPRANPMQRRISLSRLYFAEYHLHFLTQSIRKSHKRLF